MKLKALLAASMLILTLPMANVTAAEGEGRGASQSGGIEITVNINTASAEEISTLLQGIGLTKAQAIVEYRTQHGAFTAKEDLTKVKGIGSATVQKNESRILL